MPDTSLASNTARRRQERSAQRMAGRPGSSASTAPVAALDSRGEPRKIRFYFVRARKLLESREETLPALQTMLRNPTAYPDWIVERHMTFDDACRGKYLRDTLVTSHRWLTPKHPDPDGEQLRVLRAHLEAHGEIEYVWFDWFCMPQDKDGQLEVTADEKAEFGIMLEEVRVDQ